MGVNFHSEDILRDPTPIKKAKDFGLISFVWGNELADKKTVEYLEDTVGVDGVIYDRIGEQQARHNIFLLEKERKSSLFLKKSPSQNGISDAETLVNNAAQAPKHKAFDLDCPKSKYPRTSNEFKKLLS